MGGSSHRQHFYVKHSKLSCRKGGSQLTHWGRVTHICVAKLTIIGSDNGLSPGRHQAIVYTNAGILLIGPLGTHFSEILIRIHKFSFKKMHLKMSSAKWRPFFLGLNVLSPAPGSPYGSLQSRVFCVRPRPPPLIWFSFWTFFKQL